MGISEYFRVEFVHRSSLVVECDCGVIHYATEEGDYEEGEFEELESQAKEKPSKYHDHCDYTSVIMIDGRQFAVECPCDGLKKYEQFIWSHRHDILGYLKRRLSCEAEQTKRESELANEAAKAGATNE